MMLRNLLDRYIFTELLSPFSLSLGTLCFIMLTRELLRLVELLVSKGVGLWSVLKVFAHPASVVPGPDPSHCRHHCVDHGIWPAVAGQRARRDAGGRLEPLAAGPSGACCSPCWSSG